MYEKFKVLCEHFSKNLKYTSALTRDYVTHRKPNSSCTLAFCSVEMHSIQQIRVRSQNSDNSLDIGLPCNQTNN